jgi:hypothetical protein
MSPFPKIVCPRCGATNIGMMDVCLLCQSPLPFQLPVQPVTLIQHSSAQPEATWYLVVVKGPSVGRRYQLGERLSLGRDFSNDIQLNDGQVSRKHAVIQRVQDIYVVTDQGSTNGTYVNGQRISKPTILSQGTIITIGFTHFRVQAHS